MSEPENEHPDPDEALVPEDLRTGEDNPLAEPLDEDVDPDELDVMGGKTAEESADDEDRDESGDQGPDQDRGQDS